MRIYRNGRFIDSDWQHVGATHQGPLPRRAILPLASWRAALANKTDQPIEAGVAISAVEIDAVLDDTIARAPLIVIAVAKFTDGRAYSLARRMREAFAYSGELRASGDVLLDQIPLLERCGFDSFEISDAATLRALERGHRPALTLAYQPAARSTIPLRPTLIRQPTRPTPNHFATEPRS